MQFLFHGLKTLKVVKDPFEHYNQKGKPVNELVYNQRYGFFRSVMFPPMRSYEEYKLQFEGVMKNQMITDPKAMFAESKKLITRGIGELDVLVKAEQNQRNSHFYSNEELRELQRIALTNCLVGDQVLSAVSDAKKVKIDVESSNKLIPEVKLIFKSD